MLTQCSVEPCDQVGSIPAVLRHIFQLARFGRYRHRVQIIVFYFIYSFHTSFHIYDIKEFVITNSSDVEQTINENDRVALKELIPKYKNNFLQGIIPVSNFSIISFVLQKRHVNIPKLSISR